MNRLIKAINNQTNELLIGRLEYSKEWGENIFYELEGESYFEHEITIIDSNDDCRFPIAE